MAQSQAFSDVVKGSLSLYKQAFKTNFIIAIIVSVIAQLIETVGVNAITITQDNLKLDKPGLLIVSVLLTLLVATMGNALIQILLNAKRENHEVPISLAIGIAIERFLPLIFATVIYLILVIFGASLYFIPGIIIYYLFYFYMPAVLFGEMGAFQALRKSFKLVIRKPFLAFLGFLLSILVLFLPDFSIVQLAPAHVQGGGFGVMESALIFAKAFTLPLSNALILMTYFSLADNEKKRENKQTV